ncbi:unnamed protein product [Chironomus riparius]|uniref:AMP-dependent synthetase/ligase domain-containing protein n=1 Tax=Chironomus riparius TaxID=315576 RepID=A0A9N9RZP6_9DIPT|nr:unnamed protein product [Chironomus riparius]
MDSDSVDDFVFPSTDPNSIILIICSSGSTGFQKGVCKSHKHVIQYFFPYFNQNTDKPFVVLQSSYIFWFSGIYFIIVGALYKCVRIISIKPIEPQSVVDIIQDYKVNSLMIAPYAVSKILQIQNLKRLDSITELVIAGSAASKDIQNNIQKFIPNGIVCNAYGCSEENYLTINKNVLKYGSCGLPVDNTELMVVDDDFKNLGPNEKGEICSRLSIQFSGYFDEPEKTQEAFEGDWFKTGDIGYFDDDGYLYIVDRKKELLKYNNYQVTPSEIEAVINEIKGIVNSSVVGVYDANEGNDIIHAFVIVDESSNLAENVILEQVNGKHDNKSAYDEMSVEQCEFNDGK